MADIAAADTSAVILERFIVPTFTAGPPLLIVVAKITIDPGSSDAYPTGGIILSPLFTTGNASDTWLDTNQPITALGPVILRCAAATLTPLNSALFYNGGTTAAAQTLVLCGAADASGSVAQFANTDITAAGLLAAGDTDPVGVIALMGRLRPGITPTGIAGF